MIFLDQRLQNLLSSWIKILMSFVFILTIIGYIRKCRRTEWEPLVKDEFKSV